MLRCAIERIGIEQRIVDSWPTGNNVRHCWVSALQELLQIGAAIARKVTRTVPVQRSKVLHLPGVVHTVTIDIVPGVHLYAGCSFCRQGTIARQKGDGISPGPAIPGNAVCE